MHNNEALINQLFLKFKLFYRQKWTADISTIEETVLLKQEWMEALTGINEKSIAKAIIHCRQNVPWPPSIAEFIDICERLDGKLNIQEIINAVIRSDFSNRLTEMIYQKVGSWAFRNDSTKELEKKVRLAYDECSAMLRNEKIELLELK